MCPQGLLFQVAMSVFWGKFFANKKNHPGKWAAYGRLLDGCLQPLFFAFTTSFEGFFAAFCVRCVLSSNRPFCKQQHPSTLLPVNPIQRWLCGQGLSRPAAGLLMRTPSRSWRPGGKSQQPLGFGDQKVVRLEADQQLKRGWGVQ